MCINIVPVRSDFNLEKMHYYNSSLFKEDQITAIYLCLCKSEKAIYCFTKIFLVHCLAHKHNLFIIFVACFLVDGADWK